MFTRIADRLILRPSTNLIVPKTAKRRAFEFCQGELEYWVDHVPASASGPDTGRTLLIKFPGTGGRAERVSRHPAKNWGGDTVIWTVNPMGYGGSTGPATIKRYPDMIREIGRRAMDEHPDRRIVVNGNSLGSMAALAFAANFPLAGMMLRNPAVLHQLIGGRLRYVLPSLGVSKLVASAIPKFLDCVANAEKCDCPCWMLTCEKDEVIPAEFQMKVWEKLAGPKSHFLVRDARHSDSVPTDMAEMYLRWVSRFNDCLALAPVAVPVG